MNGRVRLAYLEQLQVAFRSYLAGELIYTNTRLTSWKYSGHSNVSFSLCWFLVLVALETFCLFGALLVGPAERFIFARVCDITLNYNSRNWSASDCHTAPLNA
jgi:hypothetical protein